MKMFTTPRRQNSLSLSGGGIISDQLSIPSYSPNAVVFTQQPFPWDESVDDINTPDIDPSFFEGPYFPKKDSQIQMNPQDVITPEGDLLFTTTDQSLIPNEETDQQIHPSLEENVDFSSFIDQNMSLEFKGNSMVSPNEVLADQFIPSATEPMLHYLEPRSVDSTATTVNYEYISTPSLIDSLNSHLSSQSFSSTPHSQSYSPALSVTQSYASPTPSPALSYTSTTSCPTTIASMDAITSDTTTTFDSQLEIKSEPEFLQPTVLNDIHATDHIYTQRSRGGRKRRASDVNTRQNNNNNKASKKSRVSKKAKQQQMDEDIIRYTAENAKFRSDIDRMEREIKFCKDYLTKLVTGAAAVVNRSS